MTMAKRGLDPCGTGTGAGTGTGTGTGKEPEGDTDRPSTTPFRGVSAAQLDDPTKLELR